jgi:hypothetical protein
MKQAARSSPSHVIALALPFSRKKEQKFATGEDLVISAGDFSPSRLQTRRERSIIEHDSTRVNLFKSRADRICSLLLLATVR